jgi:hypothetical protein
MEDPVQFCMFGNEGLDKQVLGLNSGGQEIENHIPGIFLQFFGLVGHGHGVIIHDAVKALMVILKFDPAFDGTKIVSQMHLSCRLNGRKHAFLFHGFVICCGGTKVIGEELLLLAVWQLLFEVDKLCGF